MAREPGLNSGERRLRLLLVVAPFGLIEYPNLAVSLLKAEVEARGFRCDVHYCSLEFARRIGFAPYRQIYVSDPQLLICDRVFARALFGDRIPPFRRYWSDVVLPYDEPLWRYVRAPEYHQGTRDALERASDDAVRYVEEYCARPDLAQYEVFGISTSYGQNTASLAIARRLKARFPDTPIIFGGANCHAEMGEQLLRSFPFIDFVCTEEGDRILPAFLEAIERGDPIDIPGIVRREVDGQVTPSRKPVLVEDLDTLPYPDFADFFTAFQFDDANAFVHAIPMETSRGCWWGEKHHCIFCGLNGKSMRFRSKSAARVAAEMRALVERFGVPKIMMTDNIMDNRFVQELLPELAEHRNHSEVFFELKANLKHRELAALAAAGFTHLQPGIESLSTRVLQLMDKGVSSFQNLQLLKWANEFGILIAWNLLCGFPGETEADYDAMALLIPKIYHLQPAIGMAQISVDRFSPLFMYPERFGIRIEPAPAYRYVYPLPPEDIANLAYTFCYEGPHADTLRTSAAPRYARRTYNAYLVWKRVWVRVDFSYTVGPDGRVSVHDTRGVAAATQHLLDAVESRVFLALDDAQSVPSLVRRLAQEGTPVGEGAVQEVLGRFEAWSYLHAEDGKYLVLANRAPTIRRNLEVPPLPATATA